MESKRILTLQEYANAHCIDCIFETTAAYLSTADMTDITRQAYPLRCSFYILILVQSGSMEIDLSDKKVMMEPDSFLVIYPYCEYLLYSNDNCEYCALLLDTRYLTEAIEEPLMVNMRKSPLSDLRPHRLDQPRAKDLAGLFLQVRRAIKQPHFYKKEIVKSLINVCVMYVSGLHLDQAELEHDYRHKEDIFMIFIHLAAKHFRKERQLRFYADQLNISTTYLSRTVKEISGKTVFDHLASMVYEEAQKLLLTTDKPMSEISMELGFNDQSAFTAYFKQRAGVSPKAFRNQKTTS